MIAATRSADENRDGGSLCRDRLRLSLPAIRMRSRKPYRRAGAGLFREALAGSCHNIEDVAGHTTSTGDWFSKARPSSHPQALGSQAMPIGKPKLMCDLEAGEIVYSGARFSYALAPTSLELVTRGPVAARANDLDEFFKAVGTWGGSTAPRLSLSQRAVSRLVGKALERCKGATQPILTDHVGKRPEAKCLA